MQELNYLKQDKKTPGRESFVTYVDFQVQDGTADMWLYDIFPGVQLMVVDFVSESCFRNGEKQNVIGINHCRKGRFECAFDSRNYLYLGEGDIALSSQNAPSDCVLFPVELLLWLHDYSIPGDYETCAGTSDVSNQCGDNIREIFFKNKIPGIPP